MPKMKKGKLCHAHGLASSITPEHPTGIGHGMDMHKPTFHLADDEFSVLREDTDFNDHKDSLGNDQQSRRF